MASEQRGSGRKIPEHEVNLSFAASGGPGGQNVNKLETKAVLRWSVKDSKTFTEEEKARIRQNLTVTKDDEVRLDCQEHRTQMANKKACFERLHTMVNEAIKVQEERKETTVPKGVKRRNEESDFREKKKKAGRGRVDW